jgi:hypothetical protein
MKPGPILADETLALCADVVDDLERVRIANENRLRQLTMDGEYGHGLDTTHPDVKRLAAIVDGITELEHDATLNLRRVMRHHPLGPWIKHRPGIGEKQFARLLAVLRDPAWNDLYNRPRTLRELYAYCGMHVLGTDTQSSSDSQISRGVGAAQLDPAAHRRRDSQHSVGGGVAPSHKRGERGNWNSTARMRLWLIADKCVQTLNSPYRQVYDDGRLKYADAVHTTPCVRCGPRGKPAAAGTALSLGHQHARARRLIAKQILRDLWTEARRLHEIAEDLT